MLDIWAFKSISHIEDILLTYEFSISTNKHEIWYRKKWETTNNKPPRPIIISDQSRVIVYRAWKLHCILCTNIGLKPVYYPKLT